ncbi:MAG: hypothetical protein GX075_03230 [Firmicutes bacterium]|nr:hypothetical protein [Bacillota bacterium]
MTEYQIDLKKHGRHGVKGEIDRVKEYYYGNGFLLASKQIDEPHKHHHGRGHHQDISFYHHDVLRSVVMLTTKNGKVEERYQYDVWGKAYEGKFEDNSPGKGHPGNVYGFTGQRYQPELGVYSFAYRDYDPRTMRWMTEDLIKSKENWYQYCNGDPLNFIDTLGLWDSRIHYGSEEYGGTKEWAQEVGFDPDEAEKIASACNAVDYDLGTNPLPLIGDQSYHFNTNNPNPTETHTPSNAADDSRRERAEEHLANAIEHQNKADDLRETRHDGFFGGIVDFVNDIRASYHEDKALEELGKGLHAIQDISAHIDGKDGYVSKESIFGYEYYTHLNERGKEADNPGYRGDPNARYHEAKKDTIEYLSRFKEGTCNNS